MHIAIDMDNTLADTTTAGIAWMNRLTGRQLTLAETHSYAFFAGFGLDEEGYQEIYAIHGNDLHWTTKPYPDAAAVVCELQAQGHIITVVTARPALFADVSRRWLAHHGIPMDNIYFEQDKLSFCERHGIDLIIEDAPHYALEFSEKGRPIMLMDHPYNRHITHDLVYRVADWQAIRRYFAGQA